MLEALMELAAREQVSSIHWLFCSAPERATLEARGFLGRTTFQFHWENRGYGDFAGFLDGLRSRKRKQIIKERRRAAAAFSSLEFVDGPDMSPDDLRALDRFYRGSDHSKVPGTGLGLPISKAIMERFGGGVEVRARDGGGTTFVLWLPGESSSAGASKDEI